MLTLGAPLNRYGFVTFLWASIVFNDINGFNVFFMIDVSISSVQRVIPFSPCRLSLEANLTLWRICGCNDDEWFLVSE